MNIIVHGIKYSENEFKDESELESVVVKEAKNIFGDNTIYIDAKRKIGTQALGGSIPDGFLFDFSDNNNCNFYLVEVELKSHSYIYHIHPQLTKFSAFYNQSLRRTELINKIYQIIEDNAGIKNEFKQYLGDLEIYKFILDLLNRSKHIMVIIDGINQENDEAISSDRDAVVGITKYLVLKRFVSGVDIIYMLYSQTDDFIREGNKSRLHYSESEYKSNIKPLISPTGSTKDTTKYLFIGITYAKNRLVLAVISDYLKAHPEATFDDLKRAFPDSLQGSPNGVFIRAEQAIDIRNRTGHSRHFLHENEILKTADNIRVAVCTQWGANLNIEKFLERARSLGYDIKELRK
jgi:hypothetical protein